MRYPSSRPRPGQVLAICDKCHEALWRDPAKLGRCGCMTVRRLAGSQELTEALSFIETLPLHEGDRVRLVSVHPKANRHLKELVGTTAKVVQDALPDGRVGVRFNDTLGSHFWVKPGYFEKTEG